MKRHFGHGTKNAPDLTPYTARTTFEPPSSYLTGLPAPIPSNAPSFEARQDSLHAADGFANFVAQQPFTADEDEDEGLNNDLEFTRLPLAALFNFDAEQWREKYERHCQMKFDEELAVYELLDLDAAGTEDLEGADVEHDESIDALVMGLLGQSR